MITILELSSVGAVHTAFALVAVVCGHAMLLRFGQHTKVLPQSPN
ncbi:hypothetical protein P3T16_004021 [Paraburkholderia sp. GAS42]